VKGKQTRRSQPALIGAACGERLDDNWRKSTVGWGGLSTKKGLAKGRESKSEEGAGECGGVFVHRKSNGEWRNTLQEWRQRELKGTGKKKKGKLPGGRWGRIFRKSSIVKL